MQSPMAVWVVLGAVCIAFHIGLVFSGLIPNLVSRPLHLALALPWIFLFQPDSAAQQSNGKIRLLLDRILCIVGISLCLAIALQHSALGDQYGYLANNTQLVLALTLIVIVLELARRAIGWPLPAVSLLALMYGLLGQHLPGEFGFSAIPWHSLLGNLTIAEGGLWGKLAGISVNTVAVFVIFGAVLNAGEAGSGFMNLATAVGGRLVGGAAKVSVISSALFGSISGSASANVASTGAITLPTMKRLGYPPAFAAATEAVASSGGQIMPPLMGAGAFVMVELTGIAYTGIVAASVLPATLFFFAVWVGINAYSRRSTLAPVDEKLLPDRRSVVITVMFFAVPFAVLLAAMFKGGFTPQYAASIATLVAAILLLTNQSLGFDWTQVKTRFAAACINAGRQVALIAAIIFCASIIIGVLGATGLGVKITSLILSASGGLLWPALLLTALACLILGMEVPTTAAYVICVSVAGPALIELGLEPLQAHLFVFWYALLSTITPPVCGAVFIAAGMLQTGWLAVAGHAMALGIGLYMIPLGMVATPSLLNLTTQPVYALLAFFKMAVALTCLAYGCLAPGYWLKRFILVFTGCCLVALPMAPI